MRGSRSSAVAARKKIASAAKDIRAGEDGVVAQAPPRPVHSAGVQEVLNRPSGAPAQHGFGYAEEVVVTELVQSALSCILTTLWSFLVSTINRMSASHGAETVMSELLYRAIFSQFLSNYWNKDLKAQHTLVFAHNVRGALDPNAAARLFGFPLTPQPAWPGDLANSSVFHEWTNKHNHNMRRLFVFKQLTVHYYRATGRLTIRVEYSIHSPEGNEVGNG
jgi:hypothetical protein